MVIDLQRARIAKAQREQQTVRLQRKYGKAAKAAAKTNAVELRSRAAL